MSLNLDVAAPLLSKMSSKDIPDRLIMGSGPSNYSTNVMEAISFPLLAPNNEEMFTLLDEIKDGIRYLFQTKNRFTFAFSGPASAAMECTIMNIVEPGKVFLVMNRGFWDARAAYIGRLNGAIVKEVTATPGTVFTLEEIEDALSRYRPTAMFITHGDSTSGTIQNMQGIGDLCRKYNAISIVDVVISIGAIPFMMDAWNIDVAYAGGQKAICAPAGISPISFGAIAEKKILSQTRSNVFYYDLKDLAKQWNIFGNTHGYYHHTLSGPLLYGLRVALGDIVEEGLRKLWERHAVAAAYFYEGLKKLEVEFFVENPNDRLYTVTPLVLPNNYNHDDIILYLRHKCGIGINMGFGPTFGKCIRVGFMGNNARVECIDRLLNGLQEALANTRS